MSMSTLVYSTLYSTLSQETNKTEKKTVDGGRGAYMYLSGVEHLFQILANIIDGALIQGGAYSMEGTYSVIYSYIYFSFG